MLDFPVPAALPGDERQLPDSGLRGAADAMPHPVWLASAAGLPTHFNRAWYAYTGSPENREPELQWRDALHPDDRQRFDECGAGATRANGPISEDFRIRSNAGEFRWHQVTLAPLAAHADDTRWLVTCTDVDEHKRSQRELLRSEARGRSRADQAPIAVSLFDTKGVPFYSNEAYLRIWNRPATETSAMPSIFDDRNLAASDVEPLICRAFAGGHVALPPMRYDLADDQTVLVQSTIFAVHDLDGSVDHVAMMQQDVTAWHAAQEAERIAREQFRAVQDASIDGFVLLRPVLDENRVPTDFAFAYVNPAGQRIMAVAGAPASARTLIEAFPALREDSLLAAYARVLATGEPYRTDYQHGSEIDPSWMSITVIRVHGDLAVTYCDSTARHRAEATLARMNATLESRVAERTAALAESETRYRSVLAATPDGIALQYADMSIGAWNQAAERLTGLTAEQLTDRVPRPRGWAAITEHGKPFSMRHHPSLVALATGKPQADCLMGIHHPDGRVVWISMNTIPLFRDGEARPYAAVTSFTDVSARRGIEAALRESEQRFSLLARHAPVGIFRTDPNGSCTFVNERYAELAGCAPDAALGDGWRNTVHPADRKRVFAEWRAASLVSRSFRLEYRLVSPEGATVWVEGSAEPIVTPGGATTGYIGSIHDVSARHLREQHLREVSLRDELTGIYNRRGLLELAEHELKRARREQGTLLMLYADVDDFKHINDALGHAAGDETLVHVGKSLRTSHRESDVVARLGGDEFVSLSVHQSPEVARIAEISIRERFSAALARGGDGTVKVSIGSAVCSSRECARLEDLIESADESLYAEKRKRRLATDGAALGK